jgi:hypothetical protein
MRVLVDGVDDLRHIGIGSVAHAVDHQRFAPGIDAAVSLPPSGRTSGSTVPWITNVGAFTARRRSLRLPEPALRAAGVRRRPD